MSETIDETKVRKACVETTERLGRLNPDILARYVMRTLYPDLVETWSVHKETAQQHELMQQILPIALETLSQQDAKSDRRLEVATAAAVELFPHHPVHIVVAVFATTFPELVSPTHPTLNVTRQNAMRRVASFVVRFLAKRGEMSLLGQVPCASN